MNKVLLNKLITVINDSLKSVPGVYQISNKMFVNQLDLEKIKTKGINLILKDGSYNITISVILIEDVNIIDVISESQRKLQYELSMMKFLMDKILKLNFCVEDIYKQD